MTADRFGPHGSGEFTALASARWAHPAGAGERIAPDPPADPAAHPTAATPSAGRAGAPARTPPAGSADAGPRRARRAPRRVSVPPQHGAWAFLVVPVLVGFAIAGASAAGWLFLLAWLVAYPVGYYAGRALTARVRRGSWTRLARRELGRAVPWAVGLLVLGIPLLLTRPWLLAAAAVLAVLWAAGLLVADRRGERSMANDLLLVAQALVAVPLAVAVVAGPSALTGPQALTVASGAAVVGIYLAGSVIHVKSLLREAGNLGFRRLNLTWHGAAVVVTTLLSAWWLLGFVPALVRAVVLRPGLRPGAIGAVEAVVAVLVVAAAVLAL